MRFLQEIKQFFDEFVHQGKIFRTEKVGWSLFYFKNKKGPTLSSPFFNLPAFICRQGYL